MAWKQWFSESREVGQYEGPENNGVFFCRLFCVHVATQNLRVASDSFQYLLKVLHFELLFVRT